MTQITSPTTPVQQQQTQAPRRREYMSRFDGILRKIIPSTAVLSYSRIFKAVGYVTDFGTKLLFREFKRLPPNHLRVRVGVGNKIFFNQVQCLTRGMNYWISAFATGVCRLDSDILEIGCGYGRNVMTLQEFEMQGRRFDGQYIGIDIEPELLAYARKRFPAEQFHFLGSPHQSKTYQSASVTPGEEHAEQRQRELFEAEVASESRDFVFSTSLFTHLLESELRDYLRLAYRVLRPGGSMLMNYFCIDHFQRQQLLGERWTFKHRDGLAYVESKKYPEAAVAYEQAAIEAICKEIGFSHVETVSDPTGTARQSHLRCRK